MANEVSERRWLALIFVLYFLLGIGYSLLMPIWEAPDEPAHYHLAWHLARKGEYATIEQNYEAVQPRTFYILGSYVIHTLDRFNPEFSSYVLPKEYKSNIRVAERRFDWNDGNNRFLPGVYALRWINLLFGALALWISWKAFCLIAPDQRTLRIAALLLAALTPQYLHIMSSVNNDALGTLAGAYLFYLTVRVVKDQDNLLAIFVVILAVVLPLATKLTVLPVSAALLAIIGGKWLFGVRQKKWLVIAGLVVVFSIGVVYFFFPEIIDWTQKEISWRLFSFRKKGLTPEYLKLISNQILQTYWGKVGWIAVGLPNWVIYLLTLLGVGGMAIQERRVALRKTADPGFSAWIVAFLMASFTALAVARNGLTTGATQGRFLFPAIGALSLLMISGWHGVLPERIQKNLPWMVMILMIILNMTLWIFGIIPVYYQPLFD